MSDIATTKRERELMEHALGIQMKGGKKTKEYRNYFTVNPGSDMDIAWTGLSDRGLAECYRDEPGYKAYSVTDLGRAQL